MTTNYFPTLQEVLAIHETIINEFGGSPGIRDQAAVESALMRPQIGYYQTFLEEAAALMESFSNNHPFVDGNKRMAFFVADTFLRINSHCIDCDNQKAYDTLMALYDSGNFRFGYLLDWLEQRVVPLGN